MFELLLPVFVGVLIGTFSGLTPGLHLNLMSVLIISLPSIDLPLLWIIVCIMSMAITHTIVDAIPSVYLGCPTEDTLATALACHKMVFEGRGHTAVCLTILGCAIAVILSIIISPLLFSVITFFNDVLAHSIVWLLVGVLAFLLIKERKKMGAIFLLVASASLGIILLQLLDLHQPLLALLSGLFGVAGILTSLVQKKNIPIQTLDAHTQTTNFEILIAGACSTIAGISAAFLPGIGSSQLAVIASSISKGGEEFFIMLSSGINTVNMSVSLVTLYVLQKARNGAVASIMQISDTLDFHIIILLLFCVLLASCIAILLALFISKLFIQMLARVNYFYIGVSVLVLIVGFTVYFDQWIGLCVLCVSTCLGYVAIKFEIAKNYLLGCLLIPVIFVL